MRPKVSFVVPCYRLAHLLGDCISSILSQTYRDFEVLIMDDCSPDDTSAVAASFRDPRVKHIRNGQNLGHLQNYNRGIGLAQGTYVWLISADDRLRQPYLVERYVRLVDDHPGVGYACCPAMILDRGAETRVDGQIATRDMVLSGEKFLLHYLLNGNCVIAASGMARRSCYEQLGAFPLDLPYAGDWFMWCLFALHFQVAYFAEPMVNYRAHELSMTNLLTNSRTAQTFGEGFKVLWRIRREAERTGAATVVRRCDNRLMKLYGRHLSGWTHNGDQYRLSNREFEAALNEVGDTDYRRTMKAGVWAAAGDQSLMQQKLPEAREYYARAAEECPSSIKIRARQALLCTGSAGSKFGKVLRTIKRAFAR